MSVKSIGAKVIDTSYAFYVGATCKKTYLSCYFWCDDKNAINNKRSTNCYMMPNLFKRWY